MKEVRLNIGCGDDIKDDMINVDELETEGSEMVVDIGSRKLPFRDKTVDYILCKHVLEHLDYDEAKFAMDEMWRVLKDSGEAEFFTPHKDVESALDFGHKTLWSEKSWEFFGKESLHRVKLWEIKELRRNQRGDLYCRAVPKK